MMELKNETDAAITKRCQSDIVEGEYVLSLKKQLAVIRTIERPQDMEQG